jgi:hypothetical protein
VIHHCSVHLDLIRGNHRLGTVILFVVTPVAFILYLLFFLNFVLSLCNA